MSLEPCYAIDKSYLENANEGPFFKGPYPEREWIKESEWFDFLGYKIASRIGVAAGPLLNSRWIAFAARLGYDVVTYKTIRSSETPSHPLPNVLPVRVRDGFAEVLPEILTDINELGITNSFGNPSRSLDYLKKDIPLALSSLKKGQVMIVSVFGSGENPKQDFAQTAFFATSCGASLIEANFSCPNVCEKGGALYQDPTAVYEVTKEIVKAIKTTPLIIKVGDFKNLDQMRQIFIAAAKGGARAIAGLNTLKLKVIPPLSIDRPTSGICGAPIRSHALLFAKNAREIIEKEKLDLTLIATGGVTNPKHFYPLLDFADVAECATGMMWDPLLAIKYHKEKICI